MAYFNLSFYSKATQRNQDVAIFYPDPVKENLPPPFLRGIIKPPQLPDGNFTYKTMYLIHGGGGSYLDWPTWTTIHHLCKEEQIMFIMPTVLDRQENMDYSGYTEFVGKELPEYISYLFPVSSKPEDTYIGGFSFGGYFAWRTGILYPEHFGTVASFSSPIDIIGDLEIRPQENYDLEELKESDHNLLWLIEKKKNEGAALPRMFESFGDDTDMCFPVNKTAINELNRILGNDSWYWIQGKGMHNLDTCDGLIRYFFKWIHTEQDKTEGKEKRL